MEPPSPDRTSVLNHSGRRLPTASLRRAVNAVLSKHRPHSPEVSLLFTGDEEIRELNRHYRKLDETTDVLTFPAPVFPGAPLGEIAISVPFAERQAKARGVNLQTELCYLAIHGALHLVGYDDEEESARQQMVCEMAAIGESIGLAPDSEWSSLPHGEVA